MDLIIVFKWLKLILLNLNSSLLPASSQFSQATCIFPPLCLCCHNSIWLTSYRPHSGKWFFFQDVFVSSKSNELSSLLVYPQHLLCSSIIKFFGFVFVFYSDPGIQVLSYVSIISATVSFFGIDDALFTFAQVCI